MFILAEIKKIIISCNKKYADGKALSLFLCNFLGPTMLVGWLYTQACIKAAVAVLGSYHTSCLISQTRSHAYPPNQLLARSYPVARDEITFFCVT